MNSETQGTKKDGVVRRICIYLGVTFVLTWIYCLAVVYPQLNNSAANAQLLIAPVMFFPAIGVLITRLVTKEGFKNSWIRPHFKGNVKTYLLAYFGPTFLILVGTALYFVVFPRQYDANCGYLQLTLEAAGTTDYAVPFFGINDTPVV